MMKDVLLTVLLASLIAASTGCSDGTQAYTCIVEPCDGVAPCTDFPTALCTNDHCGGCFTHWELSDGTDVTSACGQQ